MTKFFLKIKKYIQNGIYAISILSRVSFERVMHIAFKEVYGYFSWVFYSAFFMKNIINAIQKGRSFWDVVIFIMIMTIISLIGDLENSYYKGKVEPLTDIRINQRIYKLIYNKAKSIDLESYENPQFYNEFSLAIDGTTDKICNVVKNVCQIICGTIACVVVFFTMYTIDHMVVLFVLAPLIGNFFLSVILNKLYYKRYQESIGFNRVIDYVNRIMHLNQYAKEVRTTNVFKILKKKFALAVKGIGEVADKFSKKIIPISIVNDFMLYTVIFEGVLLYGSYRAGVSKTLSLANLAILTSIMSSATYITMSLLHAISDFVNNTLFVDSLKRFLSYREKIEVSNANSIVADENMEVRCIEFRNVSFSYDKENKVLDNISFKMEINSQNAVVGNNGSGKTTIIKLILRLYDVDEGEILLNGVNIKNYEIVSYRKLFSVAFQDYKLFAMSISDNVTMGRGERINQKKVEECLREVKLLNKIEHLEKGVEQEVTKEFTNDGIIFSGGENQKLMAARVFYSDAPLLIFDEPTSSLDPIAEYEMFQNISMHGKNKIIIFVSHRLSAVRNVDKVVMMEHGRIIEQGSHSELMNMDGKYKNMYSTQAKNYLANEVDLVGNVDEMSNIN
jgi:ATP-binding cassette subfamily B protein